MKIIQKIESETEEKIQSVQNDVSLKLQKMENDHIEKVEDMISHEESKFEIELNLALQKMENRNKLKMKMELLSEKQKTIGCLLDSIYELIIEDETLYREFLRHSIIRGVSYDMLELIICKDDDKIYDENFMDSLNRECSEKLKRSVELEIISERIEEKGVIVVDGRKRLNATVSSFINEFKRNNIVKISEVIFKNV